VTYTGDPQYQALLAAVVAAPDDDLPRLIAADWLDERGFTERAELIRTQVALERAGFCRDECRNRMDYTCRVCELHQRQRSPLVNFPAAPYWGLPAALTGTHPHRDVTHPEPGIRCHGRGVREFAFVFRRGFVHTVRGELTDWLRVAPAVVDAHPLRRIEISDMPVYPSSGNDTYYVGGLGRLPREYWRRLGSLPTRTAAQNALTEALIELARTQPAAV
jgi:uncharacterized protein (TIGR02996 family)